MWSKRMECRIRHMIVRYSAPEWHVKSLLRKSRFSAKGSNLVFLHSLSTHHKTTVISRFLFWKMPQEETLRKSLLWRQMTGKFRKVASHYAPEPAFGLFLNLPEGSAPWNPGTSIA